MRIEYFPETDSLYIELASRAGADTREIDDGIVIDVDAEGHLVGIDIDQASKRPPGRRGNVIRVCRLPDSICVDGRLASWP